MVALNYIINKFFIKYKFNTTKFEIIILNKTPIEMSPIPTYQS